MILPQTVLISNYIANMRSKFPLELLLNLFLLLLLL